MAKNDDKGFWNNIVKIFKEIYKLEFKTESGKINLISIIILGILCLILTAKEWILKIIQLVGAFVIEFKSESLSKVVYEPTNNVVVFVIFAASFFVCVIMVHVMSKSIENTNNKKGN